MKEAAKWTVVIGWTFIVLNNIDVLIIIIITHGMKSHV